MNFKLMKFAIASMVVIDLVFGMAVIVKLWPSHYNKADLNHDGKVNLTDFSIFEYYYGGGK